LLTDEIGGRSVMPYQASGIWNPLNSFYAYPAPDSLPADAHHRRTLYTFVKRNALHPTLEIFDFKARTESVARRRSSSTPLQALVLMNDPQYAEAYRRLAERILGASVSGDGATTASEDLLVSVFRTVTRRTPSAAERDVLASYHAEQLALFEGDPQKAARLLSIGVTPPDSGLDAVPLAALTQVAGLVMNSPDAFTVR
jgi:hypothetical protein